MLEDDPRSDIEADEDWHHANRHWNFRHDKFEAAVAAEMGPSPVMSSGAFTSGEVVYPDLREGPDLRTLAMTFPPDATFEQFDVASAYLPPEDSRVSLAFSALFKYPAENGPHLNSKAVRRILGARETIFKYGVYLPKNDHDADASPEKLRWRSGRQLE
jgi:hypothetical protein